MDGVTFYGLAFFRIGKEQNNSFCIYPMIGIKD